ncbi:hypothetical protein BANRA_05412 [Klebsiella quasipneumoniae]|nr:hypothetical protein BANRA_05412 [Klebsiella quasipneumoniae]
MDKTKITHVNGGFIFLGMGSFANAVVMARCEWSQRSRRRKPETAASLTALLSGNYSESKVDMAEQLNRKLKGWAMFYQFVDFKAKVFSYIDRVVFWKLAHWLPQIPYRYRFPDEVVV